MDVSQKDSVVISAVNCDTGSVTDFLMTLGKSL